MNDVIKCSDCSWLKLSSEQVVGTQCWSCLKGTMVNSKMSLTEFEEIKLQETRRTIKSTLWTKGLS